MKRFKILFIILLCFFLSGCKEYGEKRIVKMLIVTDKDISVLCYNYAEDDVLYDKFSQKNEGINNTIVKLLKDDRYDLKLCQYCIVDEPTAENMLTEVFVALNNSKFSPDINLICTDDFTGIEKYLQSALIINPIYNFNYDEKLIDAVLPLEKAKKSKIIIKEGVIIENIDETQYTVLDILTNQNKKHRYNFFEGGKALSADLTNVTTSYGVKNDTLSIEIFIKLVAYRGMSSGEKVKSNFIQSMEKSIRTEVQKIYDSDVLTDQYNLFWYKQVENFSKKNGIKINVVIK